MKSSGDERRVAADGAAWSYIAGEKGRNRVRVYERGDRPGIWIDYRDENGRRVRQQLACADRGRAKLEADDIAAKFGRQQTAPPAALTLSRLFETYEQEVTPRKSKTAQAHDRRTLPLLVRAIGGKRRVSTLSKRDVDLYVDRRRRGELAVDGNEGRAVRTRVLEQDCSLLKAVLNWATDAGDGAGGTLLDRNPIARYKVPREKAPQRAVLDVEQFKAVRTAAAAISGSVELLALMAWYTGHRSQSIRLLTWRDVDLDRRRIHWLGENDKVGNDHYTPIHPELVPHLERARAVAELTGERWLFPSPRDPRHALTGNAVVNLWKRLAPAAGIPSGKRFGWHSCRRAFANNLRDVALRDLTDLGGWTTERTVVSIYQQPSEEAQRKALGALDSLAERAPRTGTSGE